MLETLVGLKVTDEKGYRNYRDKMKPLLIKMDGGFRFDFFVSGECDLDISDRFKNEVRTSLINRLFIIFFPDKQIRDEFFGSEGYKSLKQQFFEPSVESTTIIAEWASS